MRKSIAAWLALCLAIGMLTAMPFAALAEETADAENTVTAEDTADVEDMGDDQEEVPAGESTGTLMLAPTSSVRYAEIATEKGTLNMRSSPKDNAKILEKLPRGTLVTILEEEGEWTKIRYKDTNGYVKSSFINEITEYPYDAITEHDEGEVIMAFKRTLHSLGYLKSDEINKRFDQAMVKALVKLQLMNGVTLNPDVVTPELQALIAWEKIVKHKSGYLDIETDEESGLTVAVFCWDSGGTLYEKDQSVKLSLSFGAQATGGQPPYEITVKKSLGGEASGDVVTSPFGYVWGPNTGELYIYAVVVDAAGNTVTACAPYRYTLPDRYTD